jgi:prepilin-type N-terminal cleavage/methylation domain-containing protein
MLCPLKSLMQTFKRHSTSAFTLMEVMAAVFLIAIAMTYLMELRGKAVGRAADARAVSVAARLSSQLFHKIEAGLYADLYDGVSGDFSEQDFAEYNWLIGLGDSSTVSNSSDVDLDSPEYGWRQARESRQEERDKEEGTETKPEKTRVIIIVTYPSFSGEPLEYRLESMIDSWAVYQDFELYRQLWESNNSTNKIE